MKQIEFKINTQLKKKISNGARIVTICTLFIVIIGLVLTKSMSIFFPKIKTTSDILDEINSSEYIAFGTIDCKDTVDTFVHPEIEVGLLEKGLDAEKWNKANRWIKDIIARKYADDSSMDKANEHLSELVDASSPTQCKVLDITPDKDGKYPISDEIKESKVPAIQVFDIYIPTNTSVAVEDLTEVMLESKADIKLVEVKTKARGTDDPSFSSCYEDVRYIVYNDTPANRYEEDYIVKLKLDQFGVAHVVKALVTYISRIDGIGHDSADMIYISGGSTVGDTSIFSKLNFSMLELKGYIQGWIASAKTLSVTLLIGLVSIIIVIICVCIFFPPAIIVVGVAGGIIALAFNILCFAVTLVAQLLRLLFRKPSVA